jgi:hypothetical protein
MATQSNLSLVEVVETLSCIADLEFDGDIGIARKHEMVLGNEKISYKTIHWLHKNETSSTVNLVRETFRVILHYLKQFYKIEYNQVTDPKTLEAIKSIMVLVGEAGKKLDKYTHYFHQTQRVTEFNEYQELQEFYRKKVARKIEEGAIGKWVHDIALKREEAPPSKKIKLTSVAVVQPLEPKRAFVDFETVKQDTEYELFFIRKEDGSRFFSPRLLRNIKLVCDFSGYFGERRESNPLERIKEWRDKMFHLCAKELIKSLGSRLGHFFREIRHVKDHELVSVVNQALFALMLSANPQNLMQYEAVKSCREYFEDFQSFLRKALQTNIYKKWMTHPPKQDNLFAHELLDLIHTLCKAVFINFLGVDEMIPVVEVLLEEGKNRLSREKHDEINPDKQFSSRLAADHASMATIFKHRPNGPLFKVLEILEEDSFHVLDTLLQHNMPNFLFNIVFEERRVGVIRIGAPICQEFINKAEISPEFRGFLRHYVESPSPRKHLLINLQDRTSWREYARCLALEQLQSEPGLENAINVVTLATDTEFYHQLGPYRQVNSAETFLGQFKELLLDESAGYYFPPSIDRNKLAHFIDGAFKAIHQIFFSNKNVLSRERRIDFIEIFYLFLQLKLIEWLSPDTVSLTCKDGVDVGEAYSTELFLLLKLIANEEWNQREWNFLNFMIYVPSLLIRERSMLPDRFHRLLNVVKSIENAWIEQGAESFAHMVVEGFSKLYDKSILKGVVHTK